MAESRRFACDSCRRRRVKCNGEQPCDRCERSGIACTFGSTASRTSSVSYARQLEQRVAELEAFLQTSSDIDAVARPEDLQQQHQDAGEQQVVDLLIGPKDDHVSRVAPDTVHFYKYYAAVNVLRIVADMCGKQIDSSQSSLVGTTMLEAMELKSSLPSHDGLRGFLPVLPQKQRVLELAERTIATALVCHDCLDIEDFSERLDRIYGLDHDRYLSEDKKFLALIYAIMACGKRYGQRDGEDTTLQGVGDFRASCATLDREDLLNLNSIRALILQARYLMSVAMASAAYSVIQTAVAAALRMGLDQQDGSSEAYFSSTERFRRRQVLSVLCMMDTYQASILGMPRRMNHINPRRTLGLRDEDLGDDGMSFIAHNPTSTLTESVLCQKLCHIHASILDSEFAIPGNNAEEESHTIPVARVAELEIEIEQWTDGLPEPNQLPPVIRAVHAQLVLRLHHSAAQTALYRPFLHHLAREQDDSSFNLTGYKYASKCVQAATQSIWIVEAFQTHGIFHEAIWFNTYSLAFSITILSYFVMCSKQRITIQESIDAAVKGREMLRTLAARNTTARTFYDSLNPLVERLPSFSPH